MTSLRASFWQRLRYAPRANETPRPVRVLDCLQFEDRTLFSATPLAAELLVNTDTTGAQQVHVEAQQAVAADASGNFVVAWTSNGQDGSGNGVYAQRFDAAGNKVGAEIQVNSTTANEQLHASVAVDATGNFVVAWESLLQDGAGYGIFAQRFDASGTTVGGEFQVNTTTLSDQRYPAAAMDAAGNFVVTWSSFGQDGSGYGIYGQLYDSLGAAQGSEFQISTATTGDQVYSSVAFAGTGDFIVTWTGQDADATGIYAQRFNSSGVAQGSEFLVNTTTADAQIYSSVAADSVGNFVIAWASNLQDGSGYGIYAQRFDAAGAAQGTEFRVNVATTGDQSAPRVAMAAGGSFVVSWTSTGQDAAGTDGVYFRQYDAAGTALTGEALANTTISGNQQNSSVAMQSNDSFVVVWSGNGSGDANGVFAQLYIDGNNLAPVNTVPGAQSTAEDTPLVFSAGNGNQISVADADAHSNPIQVTITATNGTLTLASLTGLTFTAGDGTDDLTMTMTGTATDINAALNGLTFAPTTNFVGAAGIAITTNDLGYSGTGGAQDDAGSIAVTVTAVNDPPENSSPGVQSTLPNTAVVFSSANGNLISISDVDAASNTMRVTIAASGGTLTLGGTTGLSFTVGDGTSDGTMTFTGNLTNINNALTTVTYNPAAGFNGTATITITTNDLGNTGAGGAQSTSNMITVNVGATIALWFSTEGDVSDGEVPNLPVWKDGAILQLSDPNLAFEPGSTSGTMSQVVNFDTLGNDGNVDIDAIQYVSRTVVIGTGGNTITLQEGDLLLSTKDSENFTSLNSLSVTKDEVFLYRPNAAGNYSSGTFLMVLDNFTAIHGGGDTWALALVESDTLVGDTVLTAGNFLFSRSGGAEDNDIYLFTPTAVGAGTTTGSVSVLIEGDDLQINPKIFGLELIENDTVIGDVTLLTGQILMSIDADDSDVGFNSIAVDKEDVFILNVSQTTLVSGTASASATLLYQGADLNMDDGGENVDALTLVASHQQPAISLPSGALAYMENDAATVLDAGATITDPYSNNYDTGNLTVSFTAGGTIDDRLAIRNQGTGAGQIGVSGSNITYGGVAIGTYAGGTDGSTPLVITFNANATPTSAQALLRNVTYRNVSDAPSTVSRTAQLVVADGDGVMSNTVTKTVSLTAVNDAPVNTVPGPQSTNEDTALVFSSGNGNQISIADIDAGGGTMQVTLTAANGAITVSGVSGLSFVTGTGAGDATMTFSGTAADINTALNGLSFAPTANFNGAAQLQIITNDQGSTGSGGAQWDTDTVAITVSAVNDAPVNTVPGAQSTNEDVALVFSSGNGNQLSIADVDAGSSAVQVTLTATNGSISLNGVAGLSFITGSGTADASMTFTGTVADINTALNGLNFTPTANFSGSAGLQIVTSDQGNTGSGGTLTDTDTVAITVAAVNDAPVNTVPGAQSTNEDTALVFSSGNGNQISVADIDAGADLLQVTLTGTNGVISLSGAAGLSFTTGDGSSDATMTFSGTAADINTALNGLSFAPTANFNGAAQLQIVTDDQGNTGSGGPLSDTDTVAITVNSVNDAPVNTVPGAQSTTEDTALVFSSGNGNQISIGDIDAGGGSMQVTLTVTNGAITLSGVSGLSFVTGTGTGDATMTFTGTIADINAALNGLSFAPMANFNGAAQLQIVTDDQGNSGSGGILSDTDTVAITVNAVNDAPVNAVPGPQSTNEDSALVFSSGNGNQISIADVDAGGGSMQVTLTATNGLITLGGVSGLSFINGTGTGDATMTFAGTIADINTALNGLSFAPTANFNGAASLQIVTSDQGNTGSGGTFTDNDTVAITVVAVNDAPVNTVPGAQSTNEDTALVFSSGNGNQISIGDVDAGAASVQVTLTASNGLITLSGVSGLSFVTGTGTGDASMTFTGTVAAINTALNGLSFAPTVNFNGAAQLQIVTDDQGNTGSGGPLSDTDTVAITVNAVNDAPVLSLPAPATTGFRQSFTFSVSQGTQIVVSDVDAGGGNLQLTITAPNGAVSLSQTTGLTFISGSGTNDGTVVVQGSLADLNNALDGLIFDPNSTYRGSTTIDVSVSDLGNSGSGGVQQDAGQVSIDVQPASQRLLISNPTTQAANNFQATFSSTSGSGIQFIDVYAENPTLTVSLSTTNGFFTLSGTNGLTFLSGSASGTAMTFTGSLAAVNASLEGALFSIDGSDATLSINGSDPPRDGTGPQSASAFIAVSQPPVFPSATPIVSVDVPVVEERAETTQTTETPGSFVMNVSALPTIALDSLYPITASYMGDASKEVVAWNNPRMTSANAPALNDSELQTAFYEQFGAKELKRLGVKAEGVISKDVALDATLPWSRIVISTKESSSETYSEMLIAGTAGVTVTLSVGYVLWSLRAASLISTFLASMPAWQAFDPLPVLDFENRRRDQDDEGEEDEDSDESQKLFTSADAVV